MLNRITTDQDDTVDALLRQIEWSRFDDTQKGRIPFANDPASATVVARLRACGESIHAVGGLDAVDEAILRITEMNSGFSDQRCKLLEALWSPIGHDTETR
ncbi:hypothetical protein MKK64_27895 [Methylobacterium sp. E-025]|uniref:hypothetical protein n=1 Tax=Methylobacterium sp. E-025 TaxID=2836561 RepID=UPI001FB95465|nr:hypothetical protein [Methylobacterium sp. E-025]MCJ2114983.1 hypothetical protein [Methylobacterium sp. E-025]